MSTTPRLRVLAGPSPTALTDISHAVNTNRAHMVKSAHFEGSVAVYIKGLPGSPDSEYFERQERRGVTWSIQVQGRFLCSYSADDVLFGNTFDRPLKLPWGSGAALKFMHFIDPTLEHDLSGPKPWALSPLISTMPYFAHARLPQVDAFPPCVPDSISDDTTQLFRCQMVMARPRHVNHGSDSESESSLSASGSMSSNSGSLSRHGESGSRSEYEVPSLDTASKRRAYFSDAGRRRQFVFGPDDVLTTDFCYGFLSFPSLALNLPGGISFDLKKYWDGQPVRFVCVERKVGPDDEETMFWCVVFEAAED